ELSFADVYFGSGSEEESDGDSSNPGSIDSIEEDAYQHGEDILLDVDEDARPSTSATPTVAPAVPSTAPSSPATRARKAASACAVSSPPVTCARRAASAAAAPAALSAAHPCRGSVTAAAAIPTPAHPCRTSTGTSGAKRRATELQDEWHDIQWCSKK
ncbi:hypothetical protein SKAU_G00136010, partial [Synaphobranchus kaupii]